MPRGRPLRKGKNRDDINIPEIKRGIKHLRNGRSLGGDFWAPLEVKSLEDEHIEGLKDLLNESERAMAAPAQALISIIPLIPKPLGGDRPVVLASLLYVSWSGIRNPDISPWEANFVAFWDSAVRGSSVLQAALGRRLLEELHVMEGGAVANTFWDLEKFYDSISLPLLIELAEEAGYPLDLFFFDLLFHLAPRVLKWADFYAEPIDPVNGILAGGQTLQQLRQDLPVSHNPPPSPQRTATHRPLPWGLR